MYVKSRRQRHDMQSAEPRRPRGTTERGAGDAAGCRWPGCGHLLPARICVRISVS